MSPLLATPCPLSRRGAARNQRLTRFHPSAYIYVSVMTSNVFLNLAARAKREHHPSLKKAPRPTRCDSDRSEVGEDACLPPFGQGTTTAAAYSLWRVRPSNTCSSTRKPEDYRATRDRRHDSRYRCCRGRTKE